MHSRTAPADAPASWLGRLGWLPWIAVGLGLEVFGRWSPGDGWDLLGALALAAVGTSAWSRWNHHLLRWWHLDGSGRWERFAAPWRVVYGFDLRGWPALPEALPRAAVLHTTRGEIRIRFTPDIAPYTVANFASLASSGKLDKTPFHRVVSDFVSQGGDPRGDGSGGPGYTVTCENNDAPYTRGAVGMALAGKDTGGSQFFLTHSEQPHLDGRYTLFGRVEEGLDVMDALGPDDRLERVELLP